MTREEALLEANQIVANAINAKDRLVQDVIADHLIKFWSKSFNAGIEVGLGYKDLEEEDAYNS